MTATLQQVCARAAELIRQRGWWNGAGYMGARLCLTIAIARASDTHDIQWNIMSHVRHRIGGESLTRWNDAQPSAEPVLALLDQIAREP